MPVKPNFAIIGAPKSGTTYLARRLAGHPQVFVAMPGGGMVTPELPFFEDPHYDPDRFAEFLANFRPSRRQTAVGFKRAAYLHRHEVAPRLRDHLPDARFIVILRRPAERAISSYFFQLRRGRVPLEPMETGLASLIARPEAWTREPGLSVIEPGFYAKHLRWLFEHVPRSRVRILSLDEVELEPARTFRGLLEWLSVDARLLPAQMDVPEYEGTYSEARLRLLALRRGLGIGAASPERSPSRGPSALRRALDFGLHNFDRLVLSRLLPASQPTPSPELARRLEATYAADLADLGDLLGSDAPSWARSA